MQSEDHRRRSSVRAGPTGKGAAAPRRQLGWGGLTDQLSPGAEGRAGSSVHYTGQNAAQRSLQQNDFPDLPGTPAKAAPQTTPAAAARRKAQPSPLQPAWPASSKQQPSTSTQRGPQNPVSELRASAHISHPQTSEDLQRQHPWAQKEVIQDVLGAVNGDTKAASFLLHQLGHMQPDSRPGRTPQSLPQTGKLSNPNTPAATSGSDVGSGGDETVDAYRMYRREANQATRQWQKALHSAARAYASGDHEGARYMAGKARQLRQTAMQAHAAAAAKIEHLQNDGRELGPLTLDLHGLHAIEAVEAVSRRLQMLHRHHFPPGPMPQLQIITGKGNHSSEGEGSLGHAVNTFLQANGLPAAPRGGVVSVQLKRQA